MPHTSQAVQPAPYSSELDASQRAFCEDSSNAIRLLAPAGSGKTFSLLWRCRYLLNALETDSPKLLVITFTRTARDELKERIQSQEEFNPLNGIADVYTLNQWGHHRLVRRKRNLQLTKRRREKQRVILNNLQPVWSRFGKLSEQLNYGRGKWKAAPEVLDLMDKLKSLGFRHDRCDSLDDVSRHLEWLRSASMHGSLTGLREQLHDLYLLEYTSEAEELEMMYENFVAFWREAVQELFDQSVITFEDQKYWPLLEIESLVQQGKLLSKPHRYDAILVDEFQDINVLDLELLKAIALLNQTELTIVGDDDQAIFEWRGASPQFILEPDRFLGGSYKTHILSTNYRSPSNIVDLAGKLIANNRNREPKTVAASSEAIATITVEQPEDLTSAIQFVVDEVRSMHEQDSTSNVALIGRMRSQLVPYQIEFARSGIEFFADIDLQVLLTRAFTDLKKMLAIAQRADGLAFSDSDPIDDIVFLCDKVNRRALWGPNRKRLRTCLARLRPRTITEGADALGSCEEQLPDAIKFQKAIHALLTAQSVSEKIEAIHDGFEGFRKDYFKSRDDVFYTRPPFDHLADYARTYGDDIGSFHRDVQEAAATLALVPEDQDEAFAHWEFQTHLMTAHRAKGKEFDAVFVLDASDGIWPLREPETEAKLEQERRLFYVAVTRARRRLCIVSCKSLGESTMRPSRFISEMGL